MIFRYRILCSRFTSIDSISFQQKMRKESASVRSDSINILKAGLSLQNISFRLLSCKTTHQYAKLEIVPMSFSSNLLRIYSHFVFRYLMQTFCFVLKNILNFFVIKSLSVDWGVFTITVLLCGIRYCCGKLFMIIIVSEVLFCAL